MERVLEFLKKAKTYYLATVEDDQPRVRPFGTIHLFENKLYIQTGKGKQVALQIEKNPKVEICAMHEGEWIRIQTTLVLDERTEAQESMLEAYPNLRAMYRSGADGNTIVYYFTETKATISAFSHGPEIIEF